MDYKIFFIIAVLVFGTSRCCGQANGNNDIADSNITSIHTEDKDTLYFPKGDMGEVFKEAWRKEQRIGGITELPEIILVSRSELKRISEQREELIVHYQYERPNRRKDGFK